MCLEILLSGSVPMGLVKIRVWCSQLNHSVPLDEPVYKPPTHGVPLHGLSFLRKEASAYSWGWGVGGGRRA